MWMWVVNSGSQCRCSALTRFGQKKDVHVSKASPQTYQQLLLKSTTTPNLRLQVHENIRAQLSHHYSFNATSESVTTGSKCQKAHVLHLQLNPLDERFPCLEGSTSPGAGFPLSNRDLPVYKSSVATKSRAYKPDS